MESMADNIEKTTGMERKFQQDREIAARESQSCPVSG
jgi:hypothetical protein